MADFGCAECGLLVKLKRLQMLERVVGVDINRDILSDNAHKTKPG